MSQQLESSYKVGLSLVVTDVDQNEFWNISLLLDTAVLLAWLSGPFVWLFAWLMGLLCQADDWLMRQERALAGYWKEGRRQGFLFVGLDGLFEKLAPLEISFIG